MFEIINPSIIGGGAGIAVFVGILAFLTLGRWLGTRAARRRVVERLAGAEALQTAVFALLGLLIAFTFSGALTRFDVRRAQAVDEANAIGTAYLRLALLPAPTQPGLRQLVREYVDARIATYRELPDLQAARAELARSQELQADIWEHAVAAVQLPETAVGTSVLVMPALNQMFDLAAVRLTATQMHPPIVIYVMLVALAFASALLAGFQAAADRSAGWLHQLGFAAIVAATVYVIIDMEYPRLGWIRLDAIDQVLVDVRAGMK